MPSKITVYRNCTASQGIPIFHYFFQITDWKWKSHTSNIILCITAAVTCCATCCATFQVVVIADRSVCCDFFSVLWLLHCINTMMLLVSDHDVALFPDRSFPSGNETTSAWTWPATKNLVEATDMLISKMFSYLFSYKPAKISWH